MIKRGDNITLAIHGTKEGMTLRFRGCDSTSPYCEKEDTAFYQPCTGYSWVHIGCVPCEWNSHFNKYETVITAWMSKCDAEYINDIEDNPDARWVSFRTWYNKKGYPTIKSHMARLRNAASIIQRKWLSTRNLYLGRKVFVVFDKYSKSENVYRGTITAFVEIKNYNTAKFAVVMYEDGDIRVYHEKHINILNDEGLRRIKTGPTARNLWDFNYKKMIVDVKKIWPESGSKFYDLQLFFQHLILTA